MRDLDAAWITGHLRRTLNTDAAVNSVDAVPIGTGQVGENVRLSLAWDRGDPDLPKSVVAKLPSTSEISRSTAVHLDTYRKEVGFYRDVEPHVDIRTPRVHAVEWDPSTHDFVLLMEDITPASQGDQLSGCAVEQAELAIDEVIGLHAPTWGRTDELDAEWLAAGGATERAIERSQMLELLTPGFNERYAGRLHHDDLAVADALTHGYERWYDRVRAWGTEHGWCVVHGDYRLDNMLFGEPPESPPLAVVDWQTAAIGLGPADVAYFCGAGLRPADRSEHERDLVRRYASGLRQRGVDLGDDAAWDGYVLGAASGYLMAVLASQIVERTDRGDEMFAVMAERHAAQIRSVGLLDLIR